MVETKQVQRLHSRNILEGEVVELARGLVCHDGVGFPSDRDITSLTALGCENLIFADLVKHATFLPIRVGNGCTRFRPRSCFLAQLTGSRGCALRTYLGFGFHPLRCC